MPYPKLVHFMVIDIGVCGKMLRYKSFVVALQVSCSDTTDKL